LKPMNVRQKGWERMSAPSHARVVSWIGSNARSTATVTKTKESNFFISPVMKWFCCFHMNSNHHKRFSSKHDDWLPEFYLRLRTRHCHPLGGGWITIYLLVRTCASASVRWLINKHALGSWLAIDEQAFEVRRVACGRGASY